MNLRNLFGWSATGLVLGPTRTSTSFSKYRNRLLSLDIARAAAISLVLIAHYGVIIPFWLGFQPIYAVALLGKLGVELFFVLSGFLIGRLLIEITELAPSRRNLGIFLLRRSMRTLPLYFLWLIVSVLFFPPAQNVTKEFLRYLTLTQNLAWPMPESNWFGVSWSLAVEEWFYLLFGSCVIGLVVLYRTVGSVCSLAAVISSILIFSVFPAWLRWKVPDTANWDTDVGKIVVLRLDSIAYGVTLAVVSINRPTLLSYPRVLGAVGLAMVIGVWLCAATNVTVVPLHVFRTFFFNVVDFGYALCIAAAVNWTKSVGWFSSSIRRLSDISYGLYVTHLTILLGFSSWFYAGILPNIPIAIAGAITVPVLLSVISFRFFEVPVMRLRPNQTFRIIYPDSSGTRKIAVHLG